MLQALRYYAKYGQRITDRISLYISLCTAALLLFHLGYPKSPEFAGQIDRWILWVFYGLFTFDAFRSILSVWALKRLRIQHYAHVLLFIYFILVVISRADGPGGWTFLQQIEWVYLGIFIFTLTELSRSALFLDNFYFNPTILFVISFLGLILLGSLLLMLPRSVESSESLRFIDAAFMATSAVCITGLTVVDVAHTFTPFGHTILLILIQLGGLGIMTFTGFFGYFFSGGLSYKNQLMYGEIIGQRKVGSVVRTLLKIIFVTLFVEAAGAILLFFSLPSSEFSTVGEQVFFAVFHAVSAFCNAGFTIIENGLHHPAYQFNYDMQLILVSLFVLGGLGFSIVFNFYTLFKRWVINLFHRVFYGRSFTYKAWVISFNSRLMAYSTLILVILSSFLFFVLEGNNSLAAHESTGGKIIASIFMGNSARTSGFSTVDPSTISLPMILVAMLLMWIGASPGSTGGGVKNTTVSVALLNIISLAKGRDHLEIFKRRISTDSVNKAFAIIMLSLLAIGLSILLLSFTDGERGFRALTFEAVSAYATCGLSLGITANLSDGGKIIILCTMFIGRVGLLTLLVAIIKNIKNKTYVYPEEKILF